MTRTETVYNVYGNPVALVVVDTEPDGAWTQQDNDLPGLMGFAVYEVEGWDFRPLGDDCGWDNPEGLCFWRYGAVSNRNPTTDYREAEWFAEGTVKWDGCVNWQTGDCLHSCDAEGLAAVLFAIRRAYATCCDAVGVEHSFS